MQRAEQERDRQIKPGMRGAGLNDCREVRHQFDPLPRWISSSGGLIWRNETNSARSYTIFNEPHTTRGNPEKLVANKKPESAGLIEAARLRGTAVTPAAAGRSGGVTT